MKFNLLTRTVCEFLVDQVKLRYTGATGQPLVSHTAGHCTPIQNWKIIM